MKFVTLATAAAAAVTTTTAIQLNTPNNININELNLQQKEQIQNEFKEQLRTKENQNEKKMSNRPVRTPFLNHQLNVDHMEILNRIHNPRMLEDSEEKPYIDEDTKDEKSLFLPPVDVNVEPSLDAAEDEAPIVEEEPTTTDESTQTDPEILILPPTIDLTEPKMKPLPKEKPTPGGSGETPPIMSKPPPLEGKPAPVEVAPAPNGEAKPAPIEKAPPKPKPSPRSLLSFLGIQDEPMMGKPKPSPKGKPMPQLPPRDPVQPMNLFPPFPMLSQTDESTTLRAKMNLLASPHSEDYSDEAYITIQAIQDYCTSDYTKYCSTTPMMNSIRSPFDAPSNLIPFGKWDTDDDADDDSAGIFVVGMVNSIFDIFNSMLGSAVVVIGVNDDETPMKPMPCSKSDQVAPNEMAGLAEMFAQPPLPPGAEGVQHPPHQERFLHGFHHSHDSQHGDQSHGPDAKFFRGPNAKPKPSPRDVWGPRHNNWDHSRSGSDSSSSSSNFDQFVLIDPSATFLGYGQDGDMCLMANYDSLTPSCQSAIDDAYALREEYVSEENHGNGCAFAAGVFATLALVGVVLCVSKRRRQKIVSTLNAIHKDPELKARVEAASGIPVPQPCCGKNNNTEPCRGKKCLTVILRILLTLALSFFLVHLAAGITLSIVNDMVYTDEETGETVEPTPVTVLLIFISFLLVEILMIVAIKKCLAGCIARRRRGNFASSGTSSSSSPSSPSSPSPSSNGFTRYFATFPLPSRKFSFFRSNPSNNGYAPLMTDEENNTEMIQSPTVVVASAPLQPQILYVPPNMPSHVAAQSVSSVSMI